MGTFGTIGKAVSGIARLGVRKAAGAIKGQVTGRIGSLKERIKALPGEVAREAVATAIGPQLAGTAIGKASEAWQTLKGKFGPQPPEVVPEEISPEVEERKVTPAVGVMDFTPVLSSLEDIRLEVRTTGARNIQAVSTLGRTVSLSGSNTAFTVAESIGDSVTTTEELMKVIGLENENTIFQLKRIQGEVRKSGSGMENFFSGRRGILGKMYSWLSGGKGLKGVLEKAVSASAVLLSGALLGGVAVAFKKIVIDQKELQETVRQSTPMKALREKFGGGADIVPSDIDKFKPGWMQKSIAEKAKAAKERGEKLAPYEEEAFEAVYGKKEGKGAAIITVTPNQAQKRLEELQERLKKAKETGWWTTKSEKEKIRQLEVEVKAAEEVVKTQKASEIKAIEETKETQKVIPIKEPLSQVQTVPKTIQAAQVPITPSKEVNDISRIEKERTIIEKTQVVKESPETLNTLGSIKDELKQINRKTGYQGKVDTRDFQDDPFVKLLATGAV
jgi:hypothetical protein